MQVKPAALFPSIFFPSIPLLPRGRSSIDRACLSERGPTLLFECYFVSRSRDGCSRVLGIPEREALNTLNRSASQISASSVILEPRARTALRNRLDHPVAAQFVITADRLRSTDDAVARSPKTITVNAR